METTLYITLNELQVEFNSLPTAVVSQDRLEQSFGYLTLTKLITALYSQDVTLNLIAAIHELGALIEGTCLSATAAPDSLSRRALIAACKYVGAQINAELCPLFTLDAPPSKVEDFDLGLSNIGLVHVQRNQNPVFCKQDVLDKDILGPSFIGYVRLNTNSSVLYYVNNVEGLKAMLTLQGEQREDFDRATAFIADGLPIPEEALNIAQSHPSHPKLSNFYYINKQKKECIELDLSSKQLDELYLLISDIHPLMPETLKNFGVELFNPLGLLMPNTLLPLEELSIEQCLRTHIRGRDGLYLIPVSVLENLELGMSRPLLNPSYHERYLSEDHIFLNNDELSRLEAHSDLTMALFEANRQYDVLSNDKSSLLGQLRNLLRLLDFNSVDGRGAEMDAAFGAYPAISDFINYYNCLTEEQIDQFPQGLREQINLLIQYGSDSKQNTKGTMNTETCIAKRRNAIYENIMGHEALLANIAMSNDTKAKLIESATASFHAAKSSLMKVITENIYRGQDRLIITRRLMSALNVRWTINSMDDLKLITQLSVDEISEVLQDVALKIAVKQQLLTIEKIVLFIIATPAEKVKVFLSAMRAEIFIKIKNSIDLASLLISLEIDKIEAVLNSLDQQYPKFLCSGDGMGKLLYYLTPAKCNAVLSVCSSQFPIWFNKPTAIRNVLTALSKEQTDVVVNAIQNQILKVCQTAKVVRELFDKLDDSSHAAVFQVIKNTLPQLCNNMQNVRDVFANLDIEQRSFVATAIQDKWPELVVKICDLRDALSCVPETHVAYVFSVLKRNLPYLCSKIQSLGVFCDTIVCLKGADNDYLYKIAKNKLLKLCSNMTAVTKLITVLSKEQRTDLLHAIKDNLSQFNYLTVSDVRDLVVYLSEDQRILVLCALHQKLPQLCENIKNVTDLLSFFPSSQYNSILYPLRHKLHILCQSEQSIVSLLSMCHEEQRTIVFNILKQTTLVPMFQNMPSNHQHHLMSYFLPHECKELQELVELAELSDMDLDESDEPESNKRLRMN